MYEGIMEASAKTKSSHNLMCIKLHLGIKIFLFFSLYFCSQFVSLNFCVVPSSFGHKKHLQRCSQNAEKTGALLHRKKPSSGIPRHQESVSCQLGCVIRGLQLWGQPEEPRRCSRGQRDQPKDCEEGLSGAGNPGKGERLECVLKTGDWWWWWLINQV